MLSRIAIAGALAAIIAVSAPTPAAAQYGAKSLGRNVGKAIGDKAAVLNAQGRRNAEQNRARRAAGGGSAEGGNKPLPQGDALEGTEAATCELGNGSALHISGSFRASAQADCGS